MIGSTKPTWTLGVLLVLVVPAVLAGIWSWLVFGGSIETLAAREREEGREAMGFVRDAVREALEGRPDRPDTTSGRLWLRIDEEGRLDPDPFAERGVTSSSDVEREPTWSAGIDYERRGEWERAIRFLEHARTHGGPEAPVEGLLALGRARARRGEVEAAIALLSAEALREERREHVTSAGLDEAFLLRMTAAMIAADAGDPEPARALLERVGRFEERVPLAAQESVLTRLVNWAGAEPPWVSFHRAVMDFVRSWRASREGSVSDALLVIPTSNVTWLLVDASHVDRLSSTMQRTFEERFPHHRLSLRTSDETVWSEAFPWLARTLHVETREPRESERLQDLAQRLLIVAITAFVIGNWLVFRSLRQERRLARLRSGFVDLVSHELRTPLTALSLRTEMLARGDLPEEKRAYYGERIHRDVKRLSALTARILDFARLEKGRWPLERTRTTVRSLLARALVETRETLRAAGKRVHVTVPRSRAGAVCVDVEVITRALANVLENAAKHAIRSQAIWVEGAETREGFTVRIEDEGPGIEPRDRETLFQPFERGRDAHGRPGSGLGLSFVRQALRIHGGDVTLDTSSRGGACFTLIFPREERP